MGDLVATAAEDVSTGQGVEVPARGADEAGEDSLPEDNVEEAAAVLKLRGPAEPTREEIEQHTEGENGLPEGDEEEEDGEA